MSVFPGNVLRDDYKFRHTFSSDVAKFLKASSGQVIMMQPEKVRSKHEPESRSLAIKVHSQYLLCMTLNERWYKVLKYK